MTVLKPGDQILDVELEAELNRRQQKLYRTSLFLGKLLLAGIIFRLMIVLYPDTTFLQSGLAGLTTELLNLTGVEASQRGIFILVEDITYRITQDCLGWKSMAAFLGLLFATPKKAAWRFAAAGLTAIAAANILRLLTTIYLDIWGVISFDIIHGFLWKWGLTAVVLVIWIIWYRRSL